MNNNSDTWKNIKEGDQESLSEIFTEYYDDLFLYAKRFEKDEDLVKDLIQELFLKIWKNRKNLSLTNNIKAYLFHSIRNISFNAQQNKNYNLLRLENVNDSFFYTESDFNIIDADLDTKKKELISLLNDLPQKQREVIFLKYFEGFDIEEIAEILDQKKQSVSNNLYRALSKLRENMLLQIFLVNF